ncbi:hypothetical protein BR93DRAFT_926284 [Coniochaeta sp. PMI_546]|nr:hypothetical protein BR93DRAFT_926284 [Coniochaeta sp. PMI_546]
MSVHANLQHVLGYLATILSQLKGNIPSCSEYTTCHNSRSDHRSIHPLLPLHTLRLDYHLHARLHTARLHVYDNSMLRGYIPRRPEEATIRSQGSFVLLEMTRGRGPVAYCFVLVGLTFPRLIPCHLKLAGQTLMKLSARPIKLRGYYGPFG